MKEALNDITPKIDESFLIIQANGDGKKKKKQGNVNGKLLRGKTSLVNLVDAQKTCAEALKCLGHILMYQGVLMKPVLFYIMQEKVFAIGFRISSIVQKEDELYHDQECRKKLNDLVLLMALHPVHKIPVPLNYCMALLTKVKHSDPNVHVRENASENLHRVEGAIHNKKEIFYFPSDYRELRDTLMFNKQTIHKFNECKSESIRNQNENHSNGKSDIVEMFTESEDDEHENADDEDENDNHGIDENVNQNESKEDSFLSAVEAEQEEEFDEESLSDENEEEEEIVDDEMAETIKPPTREVISEKMSSRSKTAKDSSAKRAAAVNDIEKTAKKPKKSDLKDEQVVEEMLADFDED